MLMTLIKKQFRECFRGYFVNARTGKARSKAGLVGMFVFFAVLMVFLSGSFFSMSFAMGELLNTPFPWLYYSMMGILALMLGTFGSVFSTYSMLYQAKDNELLLSMPIPPGKILISRICLVYGMALLYSGIAWIPTVLYGLIFGGFTVTKLVFGLVLLLFLTLLVTALTCLLGWIVALAAAKMKNKSIGIVVLSLVFFVGYLYASTQMGDFLMGIIANPDALSSGIQTWARPFYMLGMGANGDAKELLLFCAVTAAAFAVCDVVLAKSFTKIVTRSGRTEKKTTKVIIQAADVQPALLRREWQRFSSNPTYILNCGMGLFMLLVFDVAVVWQRDTLVDALPELELMIPGLKEMLPVLVMLPIAIVSSMAYITAPSISLEGKTLWVLRSLPVAGRDILWAKQKLHVMLGLPVVLLSAVVLGLCMKLSWQEILVVAVCCAACCWLTGCIGLILGLFFPNFHWTSETVPIKQSLPVLMCFVLGALVAIAVAVACILLRDSVGIQEAMTDASIVLVFACAFASRWLNTKGGEMFERL